MGLGKDERLVRAGQYDHDSVPDADGAADWTAGEPDYTERTRNYGECPASEAECGVEIGRQGLFCGLASVCMAPELRSPVDPAPPVFGGERPVLTAADMLPLQPYGCADTASGGTIRDMHGADPAGPVSNWLGGLHEL